MATRYLSNMVDSTGRSPAARLPISAANLAVPFTVTFAATAAADVVPAIHIPQGCRVVGLIVKSAALGAGVTLTAGDSTDADRFLKSFSAAAAVIKNGLDNEAADILTPAAADDHLLLTVGGAAATGVVTGIAILARD